MRSAKSQSAVEFMLLIAGILFIFLPLFYVFSDYSLKSGSDISTSMAKDVGQKLIDQSREIYYLGRFSKEVITVNIPEGIENMSTLIIDLPGDADDEFYLIMNVSNGQAKEDIVLSSEVPLVTSDCSTIACFSGYDCTYCNFNRTEAMPGKKDYRLENSEKDGRTVINISVVQWN